jgi:hypothetical protein
MPLHLPNQSAGASQMTKTSPTKPIVKPKPKPRQELIELPSDSGAIFQAVGILPGDVAFEEQGASITVEGKQYRLFYSREHRNAFEALKLNVKATGSSQRLIVYPYVRHFPKKDQPYQLAFQVVGFIGKTPIEGCISQELQDFEFRISGLWQFIPVCGTPCITVLKNFSSERVSFIKEATVEEKVRFMKASHIPLLWSNPPVRPFRFNPRLEKEQQGSSAFVQIMALFNPDQDIFEFKALRCPPASNSPRGLKAGKKDKAEVLAKSKIQQSKAKGVKSEKNKNSQPSATSH